MSLINFLLNAYADETHTIIVIDEIIFTKKIFLF
jgi:hypothetical protein